MSSSKQASLRTQAPVDLVEKYRAKAQQLQEMFPAWSNDDLHSLLVEVNGDVELAATRISDGYAVQWGSVTRKKDKKTAAANQIQSKDAPSARSDSRGGRGGRGGRSSSGRGGANANARGRGSSRSGYSGANGHSPRPNVASSNSPNQSWGDVALATDGEVDKQAHDSSEVLDDAGWGTKSDTPATTSSHWADTAAADAIPTGWATFPAASGWGNETNSNGSAFLSGKPSTAQPRQSKTPATSNLSWAQIARLQEKPSSPSPTSVTSVSVSAAQTNPSPEPTAPAEIEQEEEPEDEGQHQGWEEPTTVQPPSWDDEPHVKPPSTGLDSWLPTPETTEESKTELTEAQNQPAPESVSDQISPSLPAQLQNQSQESEPSHAVSPPSKPVTPVAQQRPAVSGHRTSARHKTSDQPVVMPVSFGTTIEKVGMQFGSLSLGGDVLDSLPAEPLAEEATPVSEPTKLEPAPIALPTTPRTQQVHESSQVVAPTAQATHNTGSTHFQPSQAQPHLTPPQHVPQTQHSLPVSTSQVPPQATSHHSTPQIQQFSPQSVSQSHALATHPMQQQLHQAPHQIPSSQSQMQSHQQYTQHGLPTHIEPSQNQTQQSPPHVPPSSQPQQPAAAGHSSYFRQAESPYFHTPTPPAGQAQESPYGTFGPLGQQGQHQPQASHLSGFGAGDYSYGDTQRGFYESYAQQSGFGNRNVLGHEDAKGPPAPQQQLAATALPPSNPQASQQHPQPPSSQGNGQPQPAAGQGPQQSYHPPLPYFYNPYPQNQYYGSPYNSAYGVPQPFVKYPAMFQPGPPGPGTAPSPASKQPAAVQPQSTPYGQGLYGQQHPSTSYDDIGYQHHTQQHQQHGLTHSQGVAASLPSTEYAKQHQQLYGGHSTQGIQGFMGLGQGTGPSSGPPLGQRTGGSPETAYKPYAPNVGVKDVGAGVGVGQTGVGQGPQGRAGVQQQPQHNQGAFYGGNRFGSSTNAGPQGQQTQQHHQTQGQGPQAHIGYPQGGSDGNFYSYQPRQQAYWQ